MMIGIAITILIQVIALLDGANNAANFISIAIGGRVLRIKEILFCVTLGDVIGAILASRTYTKFLSILYSDYSSTNWIPLIVGLISIALWLIYTTMAKVIAPVSVALLGILIGVSTLSIELYLLKLAVYLHLWILQMIFASIAMAILIKLQKRFRQMLKIVPPVLSLCILAKSISILLEISILLCIGAIVLITIILIAINKKSIKIFNRISIAIPLFVAATAHGTNDISLMLSTMSIIKSFDELNSIITSISLSCTISFGIILWAKHISRALAMGIALLDINTSRNLYTAIFIITTVFNILGIPAPITFSTLGSFIGIGIGKGFKVVNIKVITKLILMAIATIILISLPILIATLYSHIL